jgi:serine protease Do
MVSMSLARILVCIADRGACAPAAVGCGPLRRSTGEESGKMTKTGSIAARASRSAPFAWPLMTLVLLAALALAVTPALSRSAPDGFADLAAKLLPAVVNISTTQTVKRDGPEQQMPQFPPGSPFEEFFKEFFDRQQRRDAPARRATSLGSGFIIDPSGLVVTNNHVIAEADEISVILHDDTKLTAEVVGRDAKTDLALLRVKPAKPLPYVTFGDSDKSRVGDWVVAIGNPFGLGGTVTAGIISARARNINSGPYDDFLQTDASINRGNSGGPMFNLKGEVIGINTAIFSPSGGSVGIGFAIPSKLAKPLIDQLKTFGRARRGWLGVRIQTVTEELAESLGLDAPKGALVANVTEKGPAEDAKIKVGDIVLRFDGKEVEEMRHLPRIVAETEVGKRVDVAVWRQGKEVRLHVTLGEFPEDAKVASGGDGGKPDSPAEDGGAGAQTLGLTVARLTPQIRQRLSLPDDTEGVVVTEVEEGSVAGEKGVRPGDLIRKIGPDQEAVENPGQVVAKVDAARKDKLKALLFLMEREGNPRFVAIPLEKAKG